MLLHINSWAHENLCRIIVFYTMGKDKYNGSLMESLMKDEARPVSSRRARAARDKNSICSEAGLASLNPT